MPIFEFDGIRFYYEVTGEGRPFVFSHGLAANVARIQGQLEGLPGHRLILYDNRGHGRSEPAPPAERLSFGHMAGDMAALLDHLGIARAVIGGVSMGAGVALRFALQYPERTAALVLNRPAWLDQPNPPNLAFAPLLAELLEHNSANRTLELLEETSYYQDLLRTDTDAASILREVVLLNYPRTLAACYRGIVSSTPVRSLAEMQAVRAPSLVLGCRRDVFHPIEIAETWAAAIPGAVFRAICARGVDAERHLRELRACVSTFLCSCARNSDSV